MLLIRESNLDILLIIWYLRKHETVTLGPLGLTPVMSSNQVGNIRKVNFFNNSLSQFLKYFLGFSVKDAHNISDCDLDFEFQIAPKLNKVTLK